jgi:hypothetical protein
VTVPAAVDWRTIAEPVLAGLLAMGYGIAALFFLRFWRSTRDRLFVYFSSAFTLLAVQRVALAFSPWLQDEVAILYLLRLLAFVLILVGILDKNRSGG